MYNLSALVLGMKPNKCTVAFLHDLGNVTLRDGTVSLLCMT